MNTGIPSKGRLTQPLVRENGGHRPATWDEALERVATGFRAELDRYGVTVMVAPTMVVNHVARAQPDAFAFQFSVAVLVMVILGGVGNVWGVLVGAAFLSYLDQQGLADTGAWLNQHLNITIDVPKYEFGIFGVFLLVVMLFRPHGLIPEARHKLEFEEGVADEPLYDVTQ